MDSLSSLRDFLYVDTERVRSLLAQLQGGVVEEVVDRLSKSKEARAGGSVFKLFDLGASLMREKSSEQTKSLQDALYLLFEEAAIQTGLFDIAVDISDSDLWEKGQVHGELEPGQLVRVHAPTRILDSRHFRERAERFSEWPRLVTGFKHQEKLAAIKNLKERDRKLEQLVATEMGSEGVAQMAQDIGRFVEVVMAGQVSIRQFPCDVDHPDYAFVGSLLDRPGFLQEERSALFAKYGSGTTNWTVVSQIAAIPRPDSGSEPDFDPAGLVVGDRVSRARFEELALNLMIQLERTGVAAGPMHPSISITPIAVFREVPAK